MKSDALSRRGFLHTAGAGTMGAWLPRTARVRDAEASLVGVSKWDLDTPALCVDLDKLEQNLATMKAKLAGTGVATRPHAKTHKCPAIAKLQLAAGAIGICTAKVSEAEALFANGVDTILMTTSNVTANKIRRAMAIRKTNPQLHPGRRLRAERARPERRRQGSRRRRRRRDRRRGRHAQRHAGRRQALALAKLVDKLPNLKLRGIISYDGGAQHIKGFSTRLEQHAAELRAVRRRPTSR